MAEPPREPTRLASGRGEIAVWEAGKGESTVLLLHGFPDHPLGLWDLAEHLAAGGSRVICPALPGYRPSAPVPGGDYRLAAVAADLVAVLDAAGVGRVAVVGHDWGASLAYELGVSYPERITRVIALSAPHKAGFAGRRSSFGSLAAGAYALFLAYGHDAHRVAARRRWLTAALQMASPSLHRPDWPAIMDQIANEETIAEVCRYYRCDLEDTTAPRPVQVPTAVVYGAADGAMPVRLFEGLEAWFPAGESRHELAGVGHWPHLESPTCVLRLISAELDAG